MDKSQLSYKQAPNFHPNEQGAAFNQAQYLTPNFCSRPPRGREANKSEDFQSPKSLGNSMHPMLQSMDYSQNHPKLEPSQQAHHHARSEERSSLDTQQIEQDLDQMVEMILEKNPHILDDTTPEEAEEFRRQLKEQLSQEMFANISLPDMANQQSKSYSKNFRNKRKYEDSSRMEASQDIQIHNTELEEAIAKQVGPDKEVALFQDKEGNIYIQEVQSADHLEKQLPNGNIAAYACGPLKKKRYINPKIEQELVEFKVEIEEKFAKSEVNRTFVFPRKMIDQSAADRTAEHTIEETIGSVLEKNLPTHTSEEAPPAGQLQKQLNSLHHEDKKSTKDSPLLKIESSQDEVIIINEGKKESSRRRSSSYINKPLSDGKPVQNTCPSKENQGRSMTYLAGALQKQNTGKSQLEGKINTLNNSQLGTGTSKRGGRTNLSIATAQHNQPTNTVKVSHTSSNANQIGASVSQTTKASNSIPMRPKQLNSQRKGMSQEPHQTSGGPNSSTKLSVAPGRVQMKPQIDSQLHSGQQTSLDLSKQKPQGVPMHPNRVLKSSIAKTRQGERILNNSKQRNMKQGAARTINTRQGTRNRAVLNGTEGGVAQSMALDGFAPPQGQNLQQVLNSININSQLRSSHNVSHGNGKRKLVGGQHGHAVNQSMTQGPGFINSALQTGPVNQSLASGTQNIFSGTISYNENDPDQVINSSVVFSPKNAGGPRQGAATKKAQNRGSKIQVNQSFNKYMRPLNQTQGLADSLSKVAPSKIQNTMQIHSRNSSQFGANLITQNQNTNPQQPQSFQSAEKFNYVDPQAHNEAQLNRLKQMQQMITSTTSSAAGSGLGNQFVINSQPPRPTHQRGASQQNGQRKQRLVSAVDYGRNPTRQGTHSKNMSQVPKVVQNTFINTKATNFTLVRVESGNQSYPFVKWIEGSGRSNSKQKMSNHNLQQQQQNRGHHQRFNNLNIQTSIKQMSDQINGIGGAAKTQPLNTSTHVQHPQGLIMGGQGFVKSPQNNNTVASSINLTTLQQRPPQQPPRNGPNNKSAYSKTRQTKRVNIDRKLVASHDFVNQLANPTQIHSRIVQQNALSPADVPAQTPLSSGLLSTMAPYQQKGRKAERVKHNNFLVMSQDFSGNPQMNHTSYVPKKRGKQLSSNQSFGGGSKKAMLAQQFGGGQFY